MNLLHSVCKNRISTLKTERRSSRCQLFCSLSAPEVVTTTSGANIGDHVSVFSVHVICDMYLFGSFVRQNMFVYVCKCDVHTYTNTCVHNYKLFLRNFLFDSTGRYLMTSRLLGNEFCRICQCKSIMISRLPNFRFCITE